MKKLKRIMLICEGADHSGKSKLCEHLIEKYRFNYYHCGVQEDIKKYHDSVVDLALSDIISNDSNWVIDRLHLSEQVYGTIFRNGPQYDINTFQHELEKICAEEDIVFKVIICLPPRDIVIKGHAERSAKGDEMFKSVDTVYDFYAKLYEETNNKENLYKYSFTNDPDYVELDKYLENLQ